MRFSLKWLSLSLLLLSTSPAMASGLYIDRNSITFNGYHCGATFDALQNVSMSYTARDYSFSGNETNQYGYYIFEFENLTTNKRFFVLQLTRKFRSRLGQETFAFEVPDWIFCIGNQPLIRWPFSSRSTEVTQSELTIG